MARLILLGTSNAIPDEAHENTHMALVGAEGVVLIDCVSTPKVRLARVGITLDSITDLILTHFHPDHVSGVPLLLMNMWLMGRQRPLRVYGLHHCLERVEDMMGFYHWENWPEFFQVAFHRLPERERVLVLEKPEFRIYSSPVRHLVPTIGLRLEAKGGGCSAARILRGQPGSLDAGPGRHDRYAGGSRPADADPLPGRWPRRSGPAAAGAVDLPG